MAELTKKLHVKVSGTTTPCKIYSTSAEAGTSYVRAKVDNVEAYIPLVDASDGRASKVHIGSKCIATTGKPPYNKIEYKTPNTYTFTVPSGVTTLKVEVAGAGGGGGGGGKRKWGETTYKGSGGKGGNGALIYTTINVSANAVLTIIVGKGGSGAAANSPANTYGGKGGTSSISDSKNTLASAQGGDGGGCWGMSSGTPSNGTSYGNGGSGGNGGSSAPTAGAKGADGWIIIEYGGDI